MASTYKTCNCPGCFATIVGDSEGVDLCDACNEADCDPFADIGTECRVDPEEGLDIHYLKAGDRVFVDAHTSKPDKGLTYEAFEGEVQEDCRVGGSAGWDVVEVKDAFDSDLRSAYSFNIHPKR